MSILPVDEPLPAVVDELHRLCLIAPNLTLRKLVLALDKRPGNREKQRLYDAACACLTAMPKPVDGDETFIEQLVFRSVDDLQRSRLRRARARVFICGAIHRQLTALPLQPAGRRCKGRQSRYFVSAVEAPRR